MSPATWYLVPARGGSKGVPRKNVRRLGDRPLIRHVLTTLQEVSDPAHIIVSTDDAEIALLAADLATVHPRTAATAGDQATLDDVAVEVARWVLDHGGHEDDILVTVQPTSPFLTAEALGRAAAMFADGETASVVSVTDDRHLRWTTEDGKPVPLFEARVNRQWMAPTLAETGGIIAARIGPLLAHGTRILEPVGLVELAGPEALDIDDHMDWAVAEHLVGRRRIIVRADAGPALGMGHVYRATALAMEWTAHTVTLATVASADNLGVRYLEGAPFDVRRFDDEGSFDSWLAAESPDLVVFDILDTTEAQVTRAKAAAGCVVTFEDLGPGGHHADLVVNDLYASPTLSPERQLSGIAHAILAPPFETVPARAACPDTIDRVLVTFGGTDPSGLTVLATEALRGLPVTVDIVLGPGYQGAEPDTSGLEARVHRSVDNMALLVREADLALTGGGRTVAEVLSMGVIPIVLCQNAKELTHTHASGQHGVLNLGLGRGVDAEGLRAHIRLIMEDAGLRQTLWDRGRAAVRDRSNARVSERILETQKECMNE